MSEEVYEIELISIFIIGTMEKNNFVKTKRIKVLREITTCV